MRRGDITDESNDGGVVYLLSLRGITNQQTIVFADGYIAGKRIFEPINGMGAVRRLIEQLNRDEDFVVRGVEYVPYASKDNSNE